MPSLDEEIEDVNSSVTSNLDETSKETEAKAEATETVDAASSPATGEKEDKDLLSVVRDVVDKSKANASPASPAEGEEEKVEDDKVAKKPDDENYTDVPFNKHPRFQQLLRKSKALEVNAVRYQNVQRFLDDSGLSGEEASDGLTIMALAKTNPAEAWKRMKPFVQSVLIAAGEVLPEDLQSRVQQGELSHEAALEVSRHRATAQSVQTERSFREQLEQRRQQQASVSAVQNEVMAWETDRRLKDPNFDAKMEPLMKEVAWLQTKEGKPTTPEGVREQLQRAYKAVNAQLAAVTPAAPAPRPKPAVTPIRGGQVAGNVRQSELSTLDIVRQHTRR
jgi:hypothetical protein